MITLPWVLQILILSVGIHLFLRFVRQTRGSRLIRGLYVAVLVGWIGLWGLSKPLHLEELEHILQSATGFLVIIFAIVFQPELRRAIAQLGEHSFTGGLSRSTPDTLRRVARAAHSMSGRRHGALIAFEKESSLNTYVENGAQLDAEVSARLIETIFNPKGPLHDGAIVIRGSRITAAGCFFPLPQEGEFDPSMGTRHRAALGVTEESDAVVLVVSEETGAISIAHAGSMHSRISDDKLDDELHELLSATTARQTDERSGQTLGEAGAAKRSKWKGDIAWMGASIVLASGILVLAHGQISTTETVPLHIEVIVPSELRAPRSGELLVVLPSENHRLIRAPGEDSTVDVYIRGSRSQIDKTSRTLAGLFTVPSEDWVEGVVDSPAVDWRPSSLGMSFGWADRGPNLRIEQFELRTLEPTPDDLEIDASGLDPHFQLVREGVFLEPNSVEVRAPHSAFASFDLGSASAWSPIELGPDDRGELRVPLALRPDLVASGFTFAPDQTITVVIPVQPAYREIPGVTKDVALVCLQPGRMAELALWRLPADAQTARFTIQTSGLVPVGADPSSPALIERFAAIRRFVEENLHVYVDIAELSPDGGTVSVSVYHALQKDWRQALESLGIERDAVSEAAELRVKLESDQLILLESRVAPTDGEGT